MASERDEEIEVANVLTGPFEAKLTHTIELYDNTLREGEQPPGVVFTPDEKLALAQELDAIGVHWANIGFLAVSPDERRACERIAKAGLRMKLAALARLVPTDIDVTVDAGIDLVSLFVGGSDVHLKYKHEFTEAHALGMIEKGIRHAKDRGAKLVSFMPEDGSRTPLPRLLRMLQVASDAGADYLGLTDTVGVLTPSTTHQIIKVLKASFKQPIVVHFHDDLGLALANSLAAIEAGAQLIHATVNGVGERSGNAALEELAVVLRVKYGRDLGLKLDRLSALSQHVHELSGTRASEHKSITGRWCFTHEAGIHVAGILANPQTYQPFPPSLIGRQHVIAYGKHSGTQSINYAAERAGLTISDQVRKTVLERVKREAEQKTRIIDEAQVVEWLREAAPRS